MDRVMSKRLRASMRAANKGRNLRPRSSQLPAPPPEQEDVAEEIAAESPAIASPSAPAGSVHPGERPRALPDSDPRARETVREPAVAAAHDADEADTDEPDEPDEAPVLPF